MLLAKFGGASEQLLGLGVLHALILADHPGGSKNLGIRFTHYRSAYHIDDKPALKYPVGFGKYHSISSGLWQ